MTKNVEKVFEGLLSLDTLLWGVRMEVDNLELAKIYIMHKNYDEANALIKKWFPGYHFVEVNKMNAKETIRLIKEEVIKRKSDTIKNYESCLKEK